MLPTNLSDYVHLEVCHDIVLWVLTYRVELVQFYTIKKKPIIVGIDPQDSRKSSKSMVVNLIAWYNK